MTDRERFVGVWALEEIEEKNFSEGKRGEPVPGFERPVGLLFYLENGFMSVNFAGTSREPFLREFSPTSSELAAAGAAHGGYAGRWEVDESRREVLHHVETAFVPNRVGRTVCRSYSFEEDSRVLVLRPIALAPGEDAPNRILRWRRRI